MLRIRHVLPQQAYLPHTAGQTRLGGVVTGTLSMCRVQAKDGHEVELVGGTTEGRNSAFALGQVSAVCLPLWERAHFGRWNLTWLAPTFWHAARSEGVDILHVHVDPNLLLLPGAKARVLHLRTPVPMPLPPAYQRLLPRADAVIANSDYVRNAFLSVATYPEHRVFTAHNGVDSELFGTMTGSAFRETLEIPQDAILLLYVGAVVPEKGTLHLVDAMTEIVARSPTASLVVVGAASLWLRGSEYEEEVRRRAEGLPVRFLGVRSHGELPAIYGASDIFVFPSVWQEPFGLVLCEAMAAGKPVVASRVGGIPEVVVDGETGFLVPPGDVPALAQAIGRLVSDRDLLDRMGRAASERARLFTWENTARKLDNVYDMILSAKRRDR